MYVEKLNGVYLEVSQTGNLWKLLSVSWLVKDCSSMIYICSLLPVSHVSFTSSDQCVYCMPFFVQYFVLCVSSPSSSCGCVIICCLVCVFSFIIMWLCHYMLCCVCLLIHHVAVRLYVVLCVSSPL